MKKRFLGCLMGAVALCAVASCSDGTGGDDDLDNYTAITKQREAKDSMFFRTVSVMQNIQLVDYRTNEEFRKGHIKGATNIYGEEQVNAKDINSDFCKEISQTFQKDRVIFFYGSVKRINMEGHVLPAYGATLGWGKNAYHFDPGFEGWVEAGRPVCQDPACVKKCLHGNPAE